MSFAGIPTANFTDFRLITGPAVLTKPSDFANEAQQRKYFTSFYLNNMNGQEHLQGGTRPEDYIMVDDGSTAANNLPSAERSTGDPQVMKQISTEWRLTEDSMAPNRIITDLNMMSGAQFQQYKSEMAKQERRLATSYNNKFEADWFAQPDVNAQTGASGATDPTPFWTYVNEFGATAATPFDATDPNMPFGTGLPNGFTTIDGRNPSTEKYWRCWQFGYSDIPSTSTANPGANNFVGGLVKLIEVTGYTAMPWKPGESTTNNPVNNPEYFIPVSTNGQAYVHTWAASLGNYFRSSPNDPYYPNLSIAGIPFLPCSLMNSAKVYPTSGTTAPAVGAGVTEGAADLAGPRFPLISRRWLKWIMHTKYNFYMWPTRTPVKQPDVEVTFVSTLHNRLCYSRRKMGILYPTTDITGYTA